MEANREIRDGLERAMDLLFGANRPRERDGDDWRREVREAFRRRALDTHPDRAAALGRSEASMAEEFRSLLHAYQLLCRGEPSPAPRRVPGSPLRTGPREPGGAPSREAARPARDHVHRASLPQRPLLFAEFLYYSGRASWRNLVEAVAWQRRQRPAIGRIAVEWGHLSDEEVRALLEERRRDGAASEPFGEYARRKGFLTGAQLLALLGRQRRQQKRIGAFFVEAGIVGEWEMAGLGDDLSRHNARWRKSA